MTLLELALQVKVESRVKGSLHRCLQMAEAGYSRSSELGDEGAYWVPQMRKLGFTIAFTQDYVVISGWDSPEQAQGPLAVYHAAYTAAMERIRQKVRESSFKRVQDFVLEVAAQGGSRAWVPHVTKYPVWGVEDWVLLQMLKEEGLVAEEHETGILVMGW